MRSVNSLYGNGADKLLEKFAIVTRDTFQNDLIATFMGIAYGGDVEMCARHWLGVGDVYGYDTFEGGHPTHVSHDLQSYEARCMDEVYQRWGRDELSYEWQVSTLRKLGLNNAHLVKGLVTPSSCNGLRHINLAWLDMDMNASMRAGYLAVAEKIVPGGFLCTHDVLPRGHIPGNWEIFYQEYFDDQKWEEVCSEPKSYFMAWMRKGRLQNLHIITTCFRLSNLRTIARALEAGRRFFNIHWHIVFDGEKVKRGQLLEYEDVLSLPFVKYKLQETWDCFRCPTSAHTSTPSFTAANEMIHNIHDGWVWINDDDNVAHPEFFKTLYGRIIEHPIAKGWIFGQQMNGWTRDARPENVVPGGIDVAQYVLNRSLIGDSRYQIKYASDGLFIQEIYQRNPHLVLFDNRPVTFHNRLGQ